MPARGQSATSAAARSAARPTAREPAADIGRGIAILAIVLGHVLRGDAAAGLVSGRSPLFSELDAALYLWHLPVFAVLAGVFVGPAVERHGTGPFLRRRTVLFGWLYLVWSLVQGTVKLLTGSLVNTPTSPTQVLVGLVTPDSQLWWLPFLLLVSAAAAVTRPWRGGRRLWATGAGALVVSLVAWGHQGSVIFLQGLGLTAFFWLGAAAGRAGWDGLRARALPVLVLGGAVAVALAATGDPMPPTTWDGGPVPSAEVLGVVAAATSTAAALSASVMLVRTGLGRPLAALGRRSLEVFLAHIVATAGIRIVLLHLGVTEVTTHLVLGTTAGVAFPLALWWAGERVRAPWLFRPPSRLNRAASSGRE